MHAGPVAVHVLTGWLGSGKTTLINRLLRHPDLVDTAIIVNEFGEIPLDHLLVRSVTGETVVLANGCVCCTIRTDMASALIDLLERARRGEVPPFTRVFIETTGLADPVPVLGTLENDAVVRHHVRRGLVIATVDALHAFDGTVVSREALHQISAADWIVVTKTDLALPDQCEEVMRRLSAINPLAELTSEGDEMIFDLISSGAMDARRLAPQLSDGAEGHDEALVPRHSHGSETRHGAITSITISLDRPLDWPAFAVWVSLLLHAHGGQILRLKGIVNIRGSAQPVFINGVRHVLHRPIHLDAWPDADRRSRLILIVSELEPAAIRRSLATWLARAGH